MEIAKQKKSEVQSPNVDEEPKSSAEVPRVVGVKDPLKLVIQMAYFFIIFIPMMVWAMVSHFFIKPKSIRNKVVLITGSGRGLGRSLALKFAELNCHVACVDIDESNNLDTVRLIKQKYPSVKVIAYKCNVALVDDIKYLSKNIGNDLGEVDIIVNNAGLMSGAPIVGSKLDTNYLDAMLDVNLKSHFLMIGTFVSKMMERNSGHIVAIASAAAFLGGPNGATYSATKHGVLSLMESLYDELRAIPNNKIQTTCVCPYFVATNEAYSKSWDLRIPNISTKQATDATVDAILRNKRIIVIPSYLYNFLLLYRLVPDILRNILFQIFYGVINTEKLNKASNVDAVIDDLINRRKEAITTEKVVAE